MLDRSESVVKVDEMVDSVNGECLKRTHTNSGTLGSGTRVETREGIRETDDRNVRERRGALRNSGSRLRQQGQRRQRAATVGE